MKLFLRNYLSDLLPYLFTVSLACAVMRNNGALVIVTILMLAMSVLRKHL